MPEEESQLANEAVKEDDELKKDESEDLSEEKPEKKGKSMILAQFFIPWIIGLCAIALIFIFLPSDKSYTLGFWMLVYFFPPFGKESVIPLAIAGDRLEEAVRHYREVLRFDPGHARAHFNMAVAMGRLGRHAEAVAHLEAALRIDPELEAARVVLESLRGRQPPPRSDRGQQP